MDPIRGLPTDKLIRQDLFDVLLAFIRKNFFGLLVRIVVVVGDKCLRRFLANLERVEC